MGQERRQRWDRISLSAFTAIPAMTALQMVHELHHEIHHDTAGHEYRDDESH
jgi:hypothetical protein